MKLPKGDKKNSVAEGHTVEKPQQTKICIFFFPSHHTDVNVTNFG